MVNKSSRLAFLILLAVGVHAQESFGPTATEMTSAPSRPNHFFVHPILTAFTLGMDDIGTLLAFTYERNLPNGNSSLIWQPQFIFGTDKTDEEIEVSQFTTAHYLGYRQYFRSDAPKGFYVQGTGAVQFGSFDVKETLGTGTADGSAWSFGALAYLGYRWTYVFTDIGGGYQTATGSLTLDDGREVDVAAKGPALDLNLGFGF